MRAVRIGVRVALLAGLLAMVLSGCLGRKLTYLPPTLATPSPPPEPFLERRIPLSSGREVVAWEVPGGRPGGAVLLYFYGNGASLELCRRAGLLDDLRTLAGRVVSIDYPGYGESPGSPSERTIREAAGAALSHASRDGAVAVVGQSLGAAVAVAVAADHPERCSALVLLSPFTTLPDAARAHYPRWLVALGLHERYDSLSAIARARCPVLVVHGADDEIIPVAQGRTLADAVPPPRGRFVEVAGATHNDLTARGETWTAVREFLETLRR